MAADTKTHLYEWSATAASNLPADNTNIGSNFADNLQTMQSVVRYECASHDTIASATTTDIGTKDAGSLTVSGTTTITGLGTVSAGIRKWLTFSGALTLTHNGTSLILPGGANITTVAGDVGCFESLGSGNWKCLSYTPISGFAPLGSTSMANGTAGAPGLPFASDTDTGFFRVGANILGFSAGGTEIARFGAAQSKITAVTDLVITSTGTLSIGSGGSQAMSLVPTASTVGSNVELKGGEGSSVGGELVLAAGAGTGSANGGNTTISPGGSAGGFKGNLDLSNSDNPVLRVSGRRTSLCVVDAAGTPTISSGGGSGAAIVGNNNAFKVTLGSSPGTTDIVLTFSDDFANAPMVLCQYQGAAPVALTASAIASNSITITPGASMTAGDKIDVWCIGREAS